MAVKRVAMDYDDESDRASENLYRAGGQRITERDSFDLEWSRYLGISPKQMTQKQLNFRDDVFQSYSERHNIPNERRFSDAGGKSLKQDQKQTSKIVTGDKGDYKALGAKKADLSGLDTKNAEYAPITHKKRVLDKVGRQKGRIVYSEKVTITRRKRQYTVYRDSKGRFVSVK